MLGQQLTNPYTVPHMQQAVNVMYGGNYPISATHQYVRFKPASAEQFQTLQEAEDLELQDYPMDYEVTQDGDYYQDPTQGTEDFQWLYTVVPVGYTYPQGIQMEVIDNLYLPENNETLEDIAESMAGGAQYSSRRTAGSKAVTIQRMDQQADEWNYEPDPCYCDPERDCAPDPMCEYGGGPGGGGSNDPRIPKGGIQVQDILTCNVAATNVPVRQARIVCKRWFKIERTYTNDQGQFVCSKKFKNKVKVLLKTENGHARVSKIRGIRLWQLLFPVKKRLGVYDQGAMANISYVFTKPASASAHDKELPYWVATTTHNSILEYRQYAQEQGVALPPTGLKVMVTNWGFQQDAGAAPMWSKCGVIPYELNSMNDYLRFFIASQTYIASYVTLGGILKNQVDVIMGYASGDYSCAGLNSPHLKEIAYHELGHTSHFAQATCAYWQEYRAQVVKELAFGNPDTRPYGDGTETHAGVVGLGEMWGNHCQYIFTNRHYGNGGGATNFGAVIQNRIFFNGSGPAPNAYLNAIEDFNPNQQTDVHRWIPQGLPYDLTDNRNDNAFNFARPIDNVSGYTTGQCFSALQPNVRSVPALRERLLQQNGNNQQVQVNQLFGQYGY